MRWTKEEVRIDGEMESGVESELEAGGNGQGAKRRADRARRGEGGGGDGGCKVMGQRHL